MITYGTQTEDLEELTNLPDQGSGHFYAILCKIYRGSLTPVILPQLNGNLRGSSYDQQKRKWRKPKQVGTCISYGNHLWYWCHFEEQSSMDDRIPLGNENVLHSGRTRVKKKINTLGHCFQVWWPRISFCRNFRCTFPIPFLALFA